MKQRASRDNCLKIIYVLLAVVIVESVFLFASFQRKERIVIKKEEGHTAAKEKQVEEKRVEAKRPRPDRPKVRLPRIAIVLDDWGYNLNNTDLLRQIKEPLTLAILPRRTYSFEIASLAKELKQEAILHLPMEPRQEKKYRLEPDTVLIGMSASEVERILEADFKTVPGIKGVSNHMGSLATENETLMKIILQELKEADLYFLDSLTGRSVGKDLAGSLGLAYGRRDVFLDNQNDPDYICGQLEVLAKIAQQKGQAIGIGHDRPRTLEVLSRRLPELKKRGFKFVYVSDLVK